MHVAVDDDVHDGVGWLRRGWDEDRVDDVDDAVVGDDVGHDDLSVVDEDALVVDGDGDVRAVERGDHLSVAEVGAECGSSDHVVEEDVGQFRQGEEVLCGGTESASQREEGVVRGCEHREGSFTAEGASEVCRDDGSFQDVVHVAVDDDVHDGVGRGFVSEHRDGTGVAGCGGVVVVGSGHLEVDGADARPKEPKAVCRWKGEVLRIVEGFTGVDVGDAVDVVGASKRDEFHAFAGVDGQVVGRESRVARMDGVVAMASLRGVGGLGLETQRQAKKGKE